MSTAPAFGRTGIYGAILDCASDFMGGKSVLCAGSNHPLVEAGVPCDARHQQLGVDPAHVFTFMLGGRPDLAKPGNLPHAPSSIAIRVYATGPTQIPIEANGRVLSMGHSSGLHPNGKQYAVHPVGYGKNVGTPLLGMVNESLLQSPTSVVALCILLNE